MLPNPLPSGNSDFSLCVTVYQQPKIQIIEAMPEKVKLSLRV